jgi:hypothetical protein
MERIRATPEALYGGHNVFRLADFQSGDLKAERNGRCLHFFHFQDSGGIAGVGHDRQPTKVGKNLAQQFEAFAGNVGRLYRQARDVAARMGQTCNEPAAKRVRCRREHDRDG